MKADYKYVCIEDYPMKVRIYPNKSQREQFERYFYALEKAHNITLYELSQHNPMICEFKKGKDGKDDGWWPDFKAMTNKKWLDCLREQHSMIKELPADSLSGQRGLMMCDIKKKWESQGYMPIDMWFNAKDDKGHNILHYYSKSNHRAGFFLQIEAGKITRTKDNRIYVRFPKRIGDIRVRGWNDKIWFGENADMDFFDYYRDEPGYQISCYVSKNNVDEWYLSITLHYVWRPYKNETDKRPIGIDLNVTEKTGVTLSDGTMYENKKFKKKFKRRLSEIDRKLSRRYGWVNEEFRKERSKIKKANKNKDIKTPLPEPSKRYNKAAKEKSKLNHKTQVFRENYQHEISANEITKASFVGLEHLNVKGMTKNKNIAEAILDAGFYSQQQKFIYKAEWLGIPWQKTNTFDPTSHLCPACNYRMQGAEYFDEKTREWICPKCGTHHNRDHAAAQNILAIAQNYYQDGVHNQQGDLIEEEGKKKKKKPPKKPKDKILDKNHTDIIIHYVGKELRNPWIIIDTSGNVLDNAQGYGYHSVQNAQRAYNHKIKLAEERSA